MSSSSDVLVVVLEAHDVAWASLGAASEVRLDSLTAEQFISQVCAFLSAYQLLSDSNRLVVLASANTGTHVLFSDLPALLDAELPRPEPSAAIAVAAGLQTCLEQAEGSAKNCSGSLSAALSTALCMINRAVATTSASKQARILVLQTGPDQPTQYIACMNAIFSAQRLGVLIDGISVAAESPAFVEQAAHMTGGVYLRVRTPNALLQYLLSCFSCSRATRKMLELPGSKGLRFRATCFCHQRVISVGFVCSVCLSVFCARKRTCLTCGTEFGAAAAAAAAPRPVAAGADGAGPSNLSDGAGPSNRSAS